MVLSPRITAGFIIRPRLLRRAAEHVSARVFIHALGIPACRIAGRTLRIIVIRVAPREGSDKQVSNSKSSLILFQSTLPARGATAISCV